jgi:hypothetical protein
VPGGVFHFLGPPIGDGAGYYFFSGRRFREGQCRKKRNAAGRAGLGPDRARSRPIGWGTHWRGKRGRETWASSEWTRVANRRSRSAPMSVKAEIGLARLFHERYRWALCDPRAVTEQCSFSSSAPFATRPSFRPVATRSFARAPAGRPVIGRGKQRRRRRPGGPYLTICCRAAVTAWALYGFAKNKD